MIVYDVVVNGEVAETIEPVNQRYFEIRNCLIDRVEDLKVKYGEYKIYRRLIEMGA